jgi:hypothetical protein
VVDIVGGGQDFGLVDVVDTNGLEDLVVEGKEGLAFRRPRDLGSMLFSGRSPVRRKMELDVPGTQQSDRYGPWP